jgi:hypothetical protein
MLGDVNCDHIRTSVDSLLVLQFVADLLSALECPEGADTNGDTNINSLDAALILQDVAGLIDL